MDASSSTFLSVFFGANRNAADGPTSSLNVKPETCKVWISKGIVVG